MKTLSEIAFDLSKEVSADAPKTVIERDSIKLLSRLASRLDNAIQFAKQRQITDPARSDAAIRDVYDMINAVNKILDHSDTLS